MSPRIARGYRRAPGDLTDGAESSVDVLRPGRQASWIRSRIRVRWPIRRTPRRGHRPGRPPFPAAAGNGSHRSARIRLRPRPEAVQGDLLRWFIACGMGGRAEGPAMPLAGDDGRNGCPMSGDQRSLDTATGGASDRPSPTVLTSGDQRIRLDARYRAERRCTPPRAFTHATYGPLTYQRPTVVGAARGAPAANGHEPGLRRHDRGPR
jgi:hypothetical protein